MMKIIIFCIFLFLYSPCLAATYNAADCELATIQTIINDVGVVAEDVIVVPSGNCIWGEEAAYLTINKAITIQGAGPGSTNITLSDAAGTGTSCTIRFSEAATFKNMSITGSSAVSACAFSASTTNGWRINNITYVGGTVSAYFAYIGTTGSYGIIDGCDITGNSGSSELIFAKGPTDSWTTNNTIGGEDNLFVENNTFRGSGYVADVGYGGRAVFRFNTITGPMKIDLHGRNTNVGGGGRHIEIYNNLWNNQTNNFWDAIELRGGTGRIYNNSLATAYSSVQYDMQEYGSTNPGSGFSNVCQCPSDRPIIDQIGRGKNQDSEPMYWWNNLRQGNLVSPRSAGDTTACQSYCNSTYGDSLTFTMADIIVQNEDYFTSDTKPEAMSAYSAYICPHPLAGVGNCDTNTAGTGGYSLTGGGSGSGTTFMTGGTHTMTLTGGSHSLSW